MVLVGGRGSRLGGAKAAAPLAGRPLASYPLAALAEAGLETMVCAKPGETLPPLGVPVLVEPQLPRHPLCGVVAALREVEQPVVAVACDLPLLPPELLAALAEAPEPLVVPAPGGRPQPLAARYAPELLPELEAAMDRKAPLTRTVEALDPRLLGDEELRRYGDPDRIFHNINEPRDLAEAERLLRESHA